MLLNLSSSWASVARTCVLNDKPFYLGCSTLFHQA